MEFNVSSNIGGRVLTIKSGKVANQASGSVLVQYGETIVLVTAVSAHEEKGGDFLPLSVEYQERIYAAGRIPGNYFRREIGRPSEKEILTGRLIDRPIRPLFPKGYGFETQVIATVLSMDHKNDPDILAMIGASAALSISDIPFEGPIASVRIGRINGELIVNPVVEQIALCDINIVVATSKTGIVMIEGGGKIVSERAMLEAVFFGQKVLNTIIEMQEELQSKIGEKKRLFEINDGDIALVNFINNISKKKFKEALLIPTKVKRRSTLRDIRNSVFSELGDQWNEEDSVIKKILDDIEKKECRDLILLEGRRIDNRSFDEIRPITCDIGILPRPHGSAIFTRGETQVLGVLTLGSSQDEQRVETLNGEEHRSFMLHYNFPPFSVGEVKRVGAPSRRDIGHGGLSTRALENILPEKDIFDYTIRIVSEVLESNGSSSMGTICAGILAMMDGGIPIKAPVSGIAMGLVKDNNKTVILSDILGDEDHAGDMDFKVAGTENGITAFQMDIKIDGLSEDIMEKALEQAKNGRLQILDKMLTSISSPRKNVSPYAPRIINMNISPDKIRDVIGPGGKTIRALQSSTNSRIEIQDDGLVRISADSYDEVKAAKLQIEKITIKPEIGGVYLGKVVNITDFGAFVQIAPGMDGLVHISQLANHRVTKVSDVVKEGDEIRVKVLEISKDGKIRLSKKAVLEK